MRTQTDNILALDPGMRDLGYAVLSRKGLIDHGVLALRHTAASERLSRVRDAVERWIRADHPDVIVIEHIPRRPLDSLGGLPALGRLLRRIARANDIEVVTYSARTVRRTLLNHGWAGKLEVAESLTARLPQLRVYRKQTRKWQDNHWGNMFDAIALALYHQVTQPPSRGR